MTPAEVRALSVSEYLAMLRIIDEEAREQRRAAKKKGRRR